MPMSNKTIKPRLRLKELRSKKGTQRKVASELSITETHLRELESGRSVPSMRLYKRFENYFEQPGDEIFPDLNDPTFFLSECN